VIRRRFDHVFLRPTLQRIARASGGISSRPAPGPAPASRCQCRRRWQLC
jgi:hypothetical protein